MAALTRGPAWIDAAQNNSAVSLAQGYNGITGCLDRMGRCASS
jgi:hypothetical protein